MAIGYQDTDQMVVNMERGDQQELIHGIINNINVEKLPDGKEYHIFFSHASVDLKWVRQMVQILEAPPYNLLCCYDDRDFIPGRTSIFEINRAIMTSMKTVLVFTPEAVESRWCQTEVDTAITAAYDNLIEIVPIKLRKCVLPDTLNHISHLDVSYLDKNQGMERILQAVTKDAKEPELPPQVQRNMVTNGSYFNIESKRRKCSQVLDTTAEEMKIGLDVRGIAMSDPEIADIVDLINTSALMRNAWVLHSNFSCLPDKFTTQCVLLFMVTLLVPFLGTIAFFGVLVFKIMNPNDKIMSTYIMPFSPFVLCTTLSIVLPLSNTLLKVSFTNKLRDLSVNRVVDKNVIFTVTYKNRNPVLAIMKYDITMCLDHIVNEERHQNPELDIDAYKVQVMKKYLINYALSIQSGTQKATVVRHIVVYEQMCFCQYVQQQKPR